MWHGSYIVSKVLEKGAYKLVDYDRIPFGHPRSGVYLKRYYALKIFHQYLVYMCIFDFLSVLFYFIMVLGYCPTLLIPCYDLNSRDVSLLLFC